MKALTAAQQAEWPEKWGERLNPKDPVGTRVWWAWMRRTGRKPA